MTNHGSGVPRSPSCGMIAPRFRGELDTPYNLQSLCFLRVQGIQFLPPGGCLVRLVPGFVKLHQLGHGLEVVSSVIRRRMGLAAPGKPLLSFEQQRFRVGLSFP